ncbi:SURF1 family cytochrome oxidase biogenesis protein [Cryobacterium sp. PH29-G1]|uniref:SURF1 family protein n=1 Tax=Cryobacterium sp. PH29-G1 TaxID=3046211 RepID=UPI0024BB666D|nr:SURF1 family cytochrome oxidase biogenesis protein [Cryobacterium sp. PH29-G1]MDJ0347847.1 SURF1 family cytochrome oxidase biogenesis protein [Cryobacterium sp. PH29-G1]
MMVRPRWVAALLLALGIAAAFALLGHWQLDRAIESGVVVERSTEQVKPLAEIAQPDAGIAQVATGQMVTVDGSWVPGDEQLVTKRFNGGVLGYWVVSHFQTDADTAGIAVARGWAPDKETAEAVIAALQTQPENASITLTGRFLTGEAPELPDPEGDSMELTKVAPSALINLWADFIDQSVYSAYIVDAAAPAGLDVIDSPVPEVDQSLNWLNVFYAIEWVVFAGFAVFLWYRLVRDAVEREQEEAALAEAASASSPSAGA